MIFLDCVISWTFYVVPRSLYVVALLFVVSSPRVRQVHPRAGAGLPSNTMRHSRVSDSGHQAPVYLNPSFSPSQSIKRAGFEILIVSLAKQDHVMDPSTKCFFVSEVLFYEFLHLREPLLDSSDIFIWALNRGRGGKNTLYLSR